MQVSRRNFLGLLGITPITLSPFGDYWEPRITVYKVTDIYDNSPFIENYRRIHYEIGKYHYPDNICSSSGLYVWDNLEAATECLRNERSAAKIYKGIGTIKKRFGPSCSMLTLNSLKLKERVV